MGGSRFPIKTSAFSSRPRSMTAGSVPRQPWSNRPPPPPVTYNVPYQKAVSAASAPQFDFVPQQPRAKSVQANCVAETMEREASYFQTTSQDKESAGDLWNDGEIRLYGSPHTMPCSFEAASKPVTNIAEQQFENPFEFSFDLKLQDFSQINFSSDIGPFDETIHLDDAEPWTLEPSSPDRQSVSSFSVSSNGECISDFPDIADLHSLDTDIFPGLTMGYNVEDMDPKSAPAAQTSSMGLANYRNSSTRPSPTRSMTMPSQPTYVTNLSVPILKTQHCASPDGCSDELFNGFDVSLKDNSYGISSTLFDTPDADLATFSPNFQSSPDSLFSNLTSTFNPTTSFQKSFPQGSILPSSAPYDQLFHKHGSSPCAVPHHPSAYDSLSPPPDLYASLKTEPIPPPEEDMNPPSPSMKPRLQELRFPGDLYTPQYVRGHGNKREGWCGSCKPGRWLVLKNSAFWYDKSFTHGVGAATGMPFDEPQEKRRMRGNPEVWEGLCGGCGEWVGLVSSKRRGTTWFRHAYKVSFHS